MHQKIILVDDLMAGVGTVNLDNRSLYLNFEAIDKTGGITAHGEYTASPRTCRAESLRLR